jgi:hypothetical protein
VQVLTLTASPRYTFYRTGGKHRSVHYDPYNFMGILQILSLGAAVLVAAAAFAQAPRASDGHPDLSGIWQAMGTANWDLEDHASEPGPVYQLGAIGAIPQDGVYSMCNRLSAARKGRNS